MSHRTTNCRSCKTPLTPYGHWGICPVCEPDFHSHIAPPTTTSKPELLDKGIPARR